MEQRNNSKPIIIHLISGLYLGGAETMLYKLLSHSVQGKFAIEVISFLDRGEIGAKIEALGIPVHSVNMSRGLPDPLGVIRLARILRRRKPVLIQTWMHHADLLGGVIGKMALNVPIVWNLRASNLSKTIDRKTYLIAKACALVSGQIPTKIISCAENAKQFHLELGYAPEKMVVIPNGFDLNAYAISFDARASVRQELKIPPDTPIIGLVARFDPYKDHHNFVQAAAILKKKRTDIQFVLCGKGIGWETLELANWITDAGLRDNFHLLGHRDDVPRLTAAFDIASSSSMGEGFPNVLGEAMACGVPCVATDVGDSALIIGDTGIVVPPKNPEALAAGWEKLLSLSAEVRQTLGLRARQRVQEKFSLTAIAQRYENFYAELLMPAQH